MPNYNYYPQFGANPYGYNPYQQQPSQIIQPSQINGKIVDSIETAKYQEIPIGSVGYYPMANGDAIFKKEWRQDGTTQLVTYVPQIDIEKPSLDFQDIQKQIQEINGKLDDIISKQTSQKGSAMTRVKKDE